MSHFETAKSALEFVRDPAQKNRTSSGMIAASEIRLHDNPESLTLGGMDVMASDRAVTCLCQIAGIPRRFHDKVLERDPALIRELKTRLTPQGNLQYFLHTDQNAVVDNFVSENKYVISNELILQALATVDIPEGVELSIDIDEDSHTMSVQILNPDTFQFASNDDYRIGLLLKNSPSLRFNTHAVGYLGRLVCTNGMMVYDRRVGHRISHSRIMGDSIPPWILNISRSVTSGDLWNDYYAGRLHNLRTTPLSLREAFEIHDRIASEVQKAELDIENLEKSLNDYSERGLEPPPAINRVLPMDRYAELYDLDPKSVGSARYRPEATFQRTARTGISAYNACNLLTFWGTHILPMSDLSKYSGGFINRKLDLEGRAPQVTIPEDIDQFVSMN